MVIGARPGEMLVVRIGATEHEAKWVDTFGDVGDGSWLSTSIRPG